MAQKKLTWEEIKKIAAANGASADQIRHWKHRKKVSLEWQIIITKATGGVFDIRQFDEVFSA